MQLKTILRCLGLVLLILYCEYAIYYIVLRKCDWPDLDPKYKETAIKDTNEPPVKVMFLTDIHIMGSLNSVWIDRARREWQMHRAFQTAIKLHQPELVFVLGDITDEGSFCSTDEFDYYVKRFNELFQVPKTTTMYILVGNHDIGFHYRITPNLNKRFVQAFNSSSVQLISKRGNHFVLVNSVGLEGDGCFLCSHVEEELAKIEKILKCSEMGENCKEKSKLKSYSRPILLQHYPLYRPSDMECTDFDAAPMPTKAEEFRPKWECLSKEATDRVLMQIKPRIVLAGHSHYGCTKELPTGDGMEYTLSSFNWHMKWNPNYALAVFTPNNYAIVKCEMPIEMVIFGIYIFGIGFLFGYPMYEFFRRKKYVYRRLV